MSQTKQLLREMSIILLASVFLALVYNQFSPKSISLIRIPPEKVATADSLLFSQTTPKKDSAQAHPEVPVIARLHERAMKNADSMKAVVGKREKSNRYKIITLDQLKRLLAEHRGVLIDARGAHEFERGHIAGAKNFPYLEVDKHFEEMMTIPRDTLILVYCSNPECPLGRGLVDFMSQMEFHNIFLYDDGWDGWAKAGLPAEKPSGEKK